MKKEKDLCPDMTLDDLLNIDDHDDNPILGIKDIEHVMNLKKEKSEENELEKALKITSNNKMNVYCSTIDGGLKQHLKLLENKNKNDGRLIESDDNVIIINSIDDAEHLRSQKKITSIISFSSLFIRLNKRFFD